jgi:prepilin-type N-terminal cleavage/methylation domain-containing protein/prepilin-type processing-associated H-X9-DG protein
MSEANSKPDAVRSPHGFTLIELLVVCSIIALLISILLPSMGRAQEAARRAVCASGEHQTDLAIRSYTFSNKNLMPCHSFGGAWSAWLWDLPLETRDAMVANGAARNTMYCPSNRDQNKDYTWTFHNTVGGTDYVVSGYWFTFKRLGGFFPDSPNFKFLTRYTNSDSDTVVAADATIGQQNTSNFTAVPSVPPYTHRSPHLEGAVPVGGNVLFIDGHVAWRSFTDMGPLPKYNNNTGSDMYW